MAAKKCKECGGRLNIIDECNLCAIFASGKPPGGPAPSIWQGDWGKVGALAVHPKQVEEANARLKRHGIVGAYDKKGVPHIPDRGNRKKLLKLEGCHDNSGCYGD